MDNDIDSIDKKINELANDDLDGLESCLNHMEHISLWELRDKAKEMVEDISKDELKKVLQLLIDLSRESFEDE